MGLLFLSLIPFSLLPLLLVITGIAIVLRLITLRTAFGFIGFLLLIVILAPFVEALFQFLPLWLILIILVWLAVSFFTGVLRAVFGRGATDHFVGQVMYAVFAMPFRFIGYLIGRRRRL